ncbi:hypothetical protein Tco_1573231, partial [Tanacetum coccineum]
MPSIRNLSSNSDDLIDPAIMVVGRGKSPSFDMRFSTSDEGLDISSSHMIETIPTILKKVSDNMKLGSIADFFQWWDVGYLGLL